MDLLSIRDLETTFFTDQGAARAVDGVSLDVDRGQTVAVVGESGCGKTMLALSVLRLVPAPAGRITGGQVFFDGTDLLALPEAAMRSIRGNRISMIFQEPMTSLNPVFRVGEQIAEAVRLHRGATAREAHEAAVEMLRLVGIPGPDERARAYPHELSGGMRQRVVIAMALACDPELVLADEPTTALDVTIQAQILDLMMDLKERNDSAVLLITHDLGIVAQTCSRVAVMYAGQVVEQSPVPELFRDPLHPYTRGLLRSLPRPGARRRELEPIPGVVPGLRALPRGCRFHPRCPQAMPRCREERPPMLGPQAGRGVRCWLHA
ncbi:ABC transporter ATP-binding protein [Desulfocurvus vexinensis]|uniref:ABC transporter ATP-binding protein n=1 Tax=Desulfocurvus vexinensis TaxID=399548 RepID=UPI00048F30A8|nr:ABC transporter ATP-binding protein [Desulfocurvus vexinensis]